MLETDSLYDDQDKVQSVTDNDNKFSEFPCQTASKKLQLIHISPVSLHAFMKALKSDISKPYKVQIDCFKIQSLILIIKMIWKGEWVTRKIKNTIIFRTNPNS